MNDYTIKRLKYVDWAELDFMLVTGSVLHNKYGGKFKWTSKFIDQVISKGLISFCYYKNRPVGFIMATLGTSVFESETIILRQHVLYAEPGTRAAKLLMEDFIDFGKSHAKHIITMIAEHTNIKPRSLERLGFKKLEVLYRMET